MNCSILMVPLCLAMSLAACGERHDHNNEYGHSHGQHAAHAEAAKGTHGGRMLRQGDLAVELAIYEDGVPPEYRAWLYRNGEPLPPTAGNLEVVLTRLGGVVDTHRFTARTDHLLGDGEVYEPHSFDVDVRLQIGLESAHWSFESYEGRTRIGRAIAEQAGIQTAIVGPGTIRDEHEVQGLLTPMDGRYARLGARFPGPIRSVNVGVGDRVRAGQTLATVESNASLSAYAITSPIDGVVLSRDANVGEQASAMPLFELADLTMLWVDLHLFGSDTLHVAPGLPVEVIRLTDGVSARTSLDRVLPVTATASQSTVARATLSNEDGFWRPGAAVRAKVTMAEQPVALSVPLSALQRFRDWDVVFVRVGEEYEIRPLELGRRDSVLVEVLDGLNVGDEIVVEQSYLIKADIEKLGAAHDH